MSPQGPLQEEENPAFPATAVPPPFLSEKGRPRRRWPKVLGWTLGIVVALSLLSQIARDRTNDTVSRQVLGTSGALSEHDQSVLRGLSGHIRRWNIAAAPLIRDYLDTSVSVERWVRESRDDLAEMRSAQLHMTADIESIEDSGLRNTLRPFHAALKDETAAVTELHFALANLDPKAENQAIRHMNRAAAKRHRLGVALLDKLRPYVDPDELQRLLGARAGEIEDLLRP